MNKKVFLKKIRTKHAKTLYFETKEFEIFVAAITLNIPMTTS